MWSRFVMSQVKHNSYFIVGMAVGLWVSLALVPLEEEAAVCASAPALAAAVDVPDEFEPRREDKPLGSGGAPAGRSVQRPRYYSTELGMRGSLLTGVLSSEGALKVQVPALNRTLARLQPALKFFITASAMSSMPGLANVVGFTDTREMLKPFHALKYLADNYLEEYDFFFLITDSAFVNARRLSELVSQLSVSQDVYMGEPADEDSQYCALDAGILISNSVLRSVHGELEWCVRNSYSPHHHENLGRCVLHAAHVPCTRTLQGESYRSLRVERSDAADALREELARAVSARPAGAAALAALHAYTARAALQRGAAEAARLRAYLWRNSARHPPGYRNATWPAGLRRDPGLAPPPPDNRFDHLRWTLFNATHAYMPDEVRAVAPLDAAHKLALELVMEHVRAWARRAWPGAAAVELVEGARVWEPAAGLRYRLLVRLAGHAGDAGHAGGSALRSLEVVRGLGGARLVPVRYVTESARVWVVLPVPEDAPAEETLAFLDRYEKLALQQDKNTNLFVVWVSARDNSTAEARVAGAVAALADKHAAAGGAAGAGPGTVELVSAAGGAPGLQPEPQRAAAAARAALRAVAPRVPRDALLLLVPPHAQFNQDFLNRVRMNTIAGVSWFLPMPFARHSQFAHPAFRAPSGTGRFPPAPRAALLAVHRGDYDAALVSWRGADDAPVEEVLAAGELRAVRAPEPGAVLEPRPAPCRLRGEVHGEEGEGERRQCLRALQEEHFSRLDLGVRTSLAQLLLETESETH